MDLNFIEKLMMDMDASTLTKLEIEQDGFRICMEKGMSSGLQNPELNMPEGNVQNNPVSRTIVPEEEQQVHAQESNVHYEYITSPMVGTFYQAAGPGREVYVKIGDIVKKGQTVCIIESMKLMNEIEADVEGEVVAILASDQDMVEYGQKLFEIRPR